MGWSKRFSGYEYTDILCINCQWFGQFSGGGRLNDAVITKGFIVGAICSQTPTLCQAR